jgi:acyl-CoA synthetase (AMP-forming)/AMP-acid ligase II
VDLALLLEMAVADAPDRVAVADVGGASLTRRELQEAARRTATELVELGASHVGYLGPNGLALPMALFGAAMAGLPFVPFNYRLSEEQLADVIGREPGMVLVSTGDCLPQARRTPLRVVEASDLLAGEASKVGTAIATAGVIDPDAVAVLIYTSGTTAAPKAAVLRHRHLTSYILTTVDFGSADDDEAVLVSVPPYHVAGVATILSNLYSGRRIVYLDAFEPGRWVDLVRREGVTHAMVVPTMLARIVQHLAGDDGRTRGARGDDLATLRSLAYGGAKMPQPVIEEALERLPHVAFTNAYGLTETSSTITVLDPDDHRAAAASTDPAVRRRLGSAGRAVPGIELQVLDPLGAPCATGIVGDVVVRGDQVSGEYVGAPTGADGGGWFPTRDRGWLDDDGYLFVEGRSDDTIIRGGENIAPAEIEDVLLRHDAVSECAVVGVADDEWGQRIAAAVVLRPGRTASPGELRSWANLHLRSAKTPDVVEIRAELPYTDTGKLLRREVRHSFVTVVSP